MKRVKPFEDTKEPEMEVATEEEVKETTDEKSDTNDEELQFPQGIHVRIGKEPAFRQVLGYIDKCYPVFCEDKGYLDNGGQIWIYKSREPRINKNKFPYFWLTGDRSLESIQVSHPDDEVMSQFRKERMVDTNTKQVLKRIRNMKESLYTDEMLSDMNSATTIFKPIIGKDDDYLKKIVKSVMLEKNIDISRLKHKMGVRYVLPNMIAALKNETKMSVNYFSAWASLLGFDYDIVIYDNGTDKLDPLKKPLMYISSYDKVVPIDEAKEKYGNGKDKEIITVNNEEINALITEREESLKDSDN